MRFKAPVQICKFREITEIREDIKLEYEEIKGSDLEIIDVR